MPKFVNTNPHAVYVDDPDNDEQDLTRLYQGEEVSATGAFADNLAATSGLLDTSSDEYDEWKDGQEGKAGEDGDKFDVSAPEVLAVGPDLEPPEPSEADEEATEAGQAAAEQETGTTTSKKAPKKK